jgi:hypothetical protein
VVSLLLQTLCSSGALLDQRRVLLRRMVHPRRGLTRRLSAHGANIETPTTKPAFARASKAAHAYPSVMRSPKLMPHPT